MCRARRLWVIAQLRYKALFLMKHWTHGKLKTMSSTPYQLTCDTWGERLKYVSTLHRNFQTLTSMRVLAMVIWALAQVDFLLHAHAEEWATGPGSLLSIEGHVCSSLLPHGSKKARSRRKV